MVGPPHIVPSVKAKRGVRMATPFFQCMGIWGAGNKVVIQVTASSRILRPPYSSPRTSGKGVIREVGIKILIDHRGVDMGGQTIVPYVMKVLLTNSHIDKISSGLITKAVHQIINKVTIFLARPPIYTKVEISSSIRIKCQGLIIIGTTNMIL